MPRHESSIDLAGLAASITPRVPRLAAPRDAQSSGFFDLGALYSDALEQVARRVDRDALLGSSAAARTARAARAAVLRAPVHLDTNVWGHWDHVVIDASAIAPRPRALRWFFVAVAWLATTTISAALATTLPAHGAVRSRSLSSAMVVVTPRGPAVALPALATGSPVAGAQRPTDAWQVVGASTAQSASVADDTARAPAHPSTALAVIPPVAAAPNHAAKTVAPRARPPAAAAPARPSVAVDASPAAKPAPSPAAAQAAVASPVAKANAPLPNGTSLEDLIRREVQSESRRK